MPNKDNHLEQAQHNLALAEHLEYEEIYPDWVVTSLFYSAVHFIEASIFEKKYGGVEHSHKLTYINPETEIEVTSAHIKRLVMVKTHFNAIQEQYKLLYEQSRIVRYFCNFNLPTTGPSNCLTEAELITIKDCFNKVKEFFSK